MKVMQLLPALDAGGVEQGTVELHRHLLAQGHESIVISDGGRLLPKLTEAGGRHIPWRIGRKRLTSLPYLWRLRHLFREEKPDIIHLRSRLPAWFGYLAWKGLAKQERPRLVTTTHGFYTVSRYSSVMMKGERVIAVSDSVQDYIQKNYPEVSSERIRVIHRGVDPERFPSEYRPPTDWLSRWEESFPHLKGQFLITLPSRVTRWKGHEHFVDLIGALRAKGHPVHGLVAGDAHPRKQAFFDEIRQKVDQANLSEAITFIGHRQDLREVMAVSDVILSLSLDPEAFGRTTLEALSLGKPVLGYAHGGVKEQLEKLFPEGLVAPGRVEEAVKRLQDWQSHPPKPSPGIDPFSLKKMLDGILDVYYELLDERVN